MNILFLSKDYPPNLIGGVGIYTLEMSRLLAQNGHNVFVITIAREFESSYLDRGVRVFRVKPKKMKLFNLLRERLPGFVERLEYSYAVSKKISELAKKFHIDIVESCEARMEGFWYFFLRRKPKLVVKLHTPESIVFKLDNVKESMDFKLIEILENWWIERADKDICLTDAVSDLSRRHFNLRRNNFPKMLNPINADLFKPAQGAASNVKQVVLYAGRLEFRKGVHILAKAIPEVLKRVPGVKFIFIGSDCGMKPYILKKIEEAGCKEEVEFLENIVREDMVNYYQRADICVIPSLWENHPYVCLEAMACGKPVIASRVAGLAEIIRDDSVKGLLVTPGSTRELADKIVGLLKDTELKNRLGINARKFIEEEYAADKISARAAEIYENVLKNR